MKKNAEKNITKQKKTLICTELKKKKEVKMKYKIKPIF